MSELEFIRQRKKLFLIAGPCVVENELNPFEIAEHLVRVVEELSMPFIFKASYKKANRSSLHSFAGLGDLKALEIIQKVGETYQIPTITDVHSPEEARIAAEYVDVLQIPAFLCRQTELLLASGETGCWINVKKGQFMSPDAMRFAMEKIQSTHNEKVMLTERGTTFGYHDLVVDMRSIPTMASIAPVVMDCTHSLQRPNQSSGVTGGQPKWIELMATTATAAGADGLFIETHPNPQEALSDGANMLPLDQMEALLRKVKRVREAIDV